MLRGATGILLSSLLMMSHTILHICGPIPLEWITKAAGGEGKTLHVAMALWFLAGLKRSRKVALSQSKLKLFGVSRQASYRALSRLEGAGLVSVVRHPGRSPIVTIQLHLRSLDDFADRPIPGTEGALGSPFFSPDGNLSRRRELVLPWNDKRQSNPSHRA